MTNASATLGAQEPHHARIGETDLWHPGYVVLLPNRGNGEAVATACGMGHSYLLEDPEYIVDEREGDAKRGCVVGMDGEEVACGLKG